MKTFIFILLFSLTSASANSSIKCSSYLSEDPEMQVRVYETSTANLPALSAKVTTITDLLTLMSKKHEKNDRAYQMIQRTWEDIRLDIFHLRTREAQLRPKGKTFTLNLIFEIQLALGGFSPTINTEGREIGPRHPEYNRVTELLGESAYLIDPF